MEALEKNDIQGMVLNGYGKMAHTRYAMLRVHDAARAKAWLAQISLEVSDGNHNPTSTALNVAVSYPGLQALGLREDNLRQFAREFREGLTNPHRQRLLGDEGEDSPDHWRWGGTRGDAQAGNIHIVLLVFAATDEIMTQYWAQLEPVIHGHGMRVLTTLDGSLAKKNKEAFGFRDGIAQPLIAGNRPTSNPDDLTNTVAAGEFVLGYKNEYGVLPESPVIPADKQQGDVALLPTIDAEHKDLGRNGSYLVFRQLQQHVGRFWDYMRANAPTRVEQVRLASKMVGRWPDGAPLALFPDADPGDGHATDDFGYAKDKEGLGCPFGAHLRRSNPRDAFEDNSPERSLSLTKKHRIMRRGRGYKMKVADAPHDEVGLHFLCFNADISHQFEFIQHTWVNFPRFDRLYNDPDPIAGAVRNPPEGVVQNFTIPGGVPKCPVNRHLNDLPRFITVRGGAYFFLPSIKAIKYLATI